MLKSIYSELINIEPGVEELYIDPWFENSGNEYLELLYQDVHNKTKHHHRSQGQLDFAVCRTL